jgi:hypothetical protein
MGFKTQVGSLLLLSSQPLFYPVTGSKIETPSNYNIERQLK